MSAMICLGEKKKKKLLAWYEALNCYFFELKKCYGNVEMKNYFKLK